uniref:Cytochrome c oxidase subunit 2 n=1 Tax=Trixagus sp. TRI01 TaxID=1205587 RepID=A0A0S2MQB6_9COLE|nr:cytochrome c oxidase subunit 2 [Trixagus sp. TRI01]
MATWSQVNLINSASPLMEQLSIFHDHSMMIIMMITSIVLYMMISVSINKLINRSPMEEQIVETTWTILPAIILIFIALPSLRLLYLIDEIENPSISIKSIGHQWFWSYELSDFKNIEFESYMMNENPKLRNLEVDNRLPIPFKTQIRMLISSTDVIHSWTIPSLGLKIDASPGRLNQLSFSINKPGCFFGQCSEICGTNHSFMPIVVESINMNSFIKWIK